jgi:hypothetical protein
MSAQQAISLLHIGKLATPHRQSLCLVRTIGPAHAMVRASLPVLQGASVTLGLRNGMAIAAQVESSENERIMLTFSQAMTMERLITDQARGRCGPESVRLAVAGAARVETGGRDIVCHLRDLSLFGVQLSDPTNTLTPDAQVTVHIAGLARRAATVRWIRDGHAGLRFGFSLGYELLDHWLAAQGSAPSQPRFAAATVERL